MQRQRQRQKKDVDPKQGLLSSSSQPKRESSDCPIYRTLFRDGNSHNEGAFKHHLETLSYGALTAQVVCPSPTPAAPRAEAWNPEWGFVREVDVHNESTPASPWGGAGWCGDGSAAERDSLALASGWGKAAFVLSGCGIVGGWSVALLSINSRACCGARARFMRSMLPASNALSLGNPRISRFAHSSSSHERAH